MLMTSPSRVGTRSKPECSPSSPTKAIRWSYLPPAGSLSRCYRAPREAVRPSEGATGSSSLRRRPRWSPGGALFLRAEHLVVELGTVERAPEELLWSPPPPSTASPPRPGVCTSPCCTRSSKAPCATGSSRSTTGMTARATSAAGTRHDEPPDRPGRPRGAGRVLVVAGVATAPSVPVPSSRAGWCPAPGWLSGTLGGVMRHRPGLPAGRRCRSGGGRVSAASGSCGRATRFC
jgi:hypothetical protein